MKFKKGNLSSFLLITDQAHTKNDDDDESSNKDFEISLLSC